MLRNLSLYLTCQEKVEGKSQEMINGDHFDITFSSFGLVVVVVVVGLRVAGAESLGSSCCIIACLLCCCCFTPESCTESEVSELFLSPPPLRNSLSSSFPFRAGLQATGRGKNLINNLTSLTLDSAFLSTSRGLVEVHLEPKKRKPLFLKKQIECGVCVTCSWRDTYFTRRDLAYFSISQ